MKKIGGYIVIIIGVILLALTVFMYKKAKQPYVHYKVYLDSELMGVIESKTELETYINSQASSIKKNLEKYQRRLDSIDTFNKYNDKKDISKYEDVNQILSNKEKYKLTEIDEDNLKEQPLNITEIRRMHMKILIYFTLHLPSNIIVIYYNK